MNNANYATEQILEYLLKNGWVSSNCFSSEHVISNIKQIIVNASLSNIQFSTNRQKQTNDSAITYTFTV